VHPRFDRAKAEAFPREDEHRAPQPRAELSKGMVAQLHLALVMAIDAQLLVLDEPTLGLDILYPQAVLRRAAERLLRPQPHHRADDAPGGEIQHVLTDLCSSTAGGSCCVQHGGVRERATWR
jgi:ABC-2 type transport system ATP-binding protein